MVVGKPGIKLKSMSVRSSRWISLRLPWNPRIAVRVLLKRANLSFVLRCMWLPAYFSPCFLLVFCWLCCILVPFLDLFCCKYKGIEWRLLNYQSLFGYTLLILLFFFMFLVDLCYGLSRIWLWGRMCNSYVKESFLAAIPQFSCWGIQPCIVSSVDFSFIVILLIGKSVGSVCTSLQTSFIICTSESLTELCLIKV